MPRINVDDSIYSDVRFIQLTIKLKDPDTALGALVRAWALAQKWYLTESKMIPLAEWKKQLIKDEIIEVGLAEIKDDAVWIKGADEQFTWLVQRVNAGKLGGLAKANRPLTVAKPLPLPLPLPLPHKEIKNTNFFPKNGEGAGSGELAKRALLGVKLYGRDDVKGLMKFIGSSGFDKVRSLPGGWAAIRQMKDDQWTLTNLAKALDDA